MIAILIIACGLLATGFIAVLIRLLLVKSDLRQASKRLAEIVDADTNAILHTRTYDKDIIAFTIIINSILRKNRVEHFEIIHTEAALKRAITNISHDLRTPLTAARGYLQMLESAELDPKTQARYVEIIRERLENLSTLMNSLFEFARIIEGDTALTMQDINVGNILRDTLSEAYGELESKGFTVDINIPDTPVIFHCDADALRRVLQNLLKNVCVHGEEYLRVSLTDNKIEISNKAGNLNKLDTAHMFDRFYTSDASRNNKNTGLGLAIAKELTQRMGSQISASKEGDMLIMRLQKPLAKTSKF